jgi:hypothetical protein
MFVVAEFNVSVEFRLAIRCFHNFLPPGCERVSMRRDDGSQLVAEHHLCRGESIFSGGIPELQHPLGETSDVTSPVGAILATRSFMAATATSACPLLWE